MGRCLVWDIPDIHAKQGWHTQLVEGLGSQGAETLSAGHARPKFRDLVTPDHLGCRPCMHGQQGSRAGSGGCQLPAPWMTTP